jgi:hypothetical protein
VGSDPQFMNGVAGEHFGSWPEFIKVGISLFCRTKTLPILYPTEDLNNYD